MDLFIDSEIRWYKGRGPWAGLADERYRVSIKIKANGFMEKIPQRIGLPLKCAKKVNCKIGLNNEKVLQPETPV